MKTFLSFTEVDQIALHLHLDECSLQINHFAGCMLAMWRSVKPLSCAQNRTGCTQSFLKHWLHSPKDALSTFFTAPHTFPELYCETWLLLGRAVFHAFVALSKKLKRHLWYFSNLASVQCLFWLSGGRRGQSGWQMVTGFRWTQKMPSILS